MNSLMCAICGEPITSRQEVASVPCCGKLHASCAEGHFDQHDECPQCGLPVRAYHQDGDEILVRDDDEHDDEEDDDQEEEEDDSGIDDGSGEDTSGEQNRSSDNGADSDFIDDGTIAEKSWSDGSEPEYQPSPLAKKHRK